MQQLNLSDLIRVITCILLIISIIVNISILRALKKSTGKNILDGIEEGANTLAKVLKALKLDSIADVIGLFKDVIKETPTDTDNASQKALNEHTESNT